MSKISESWKQVHGVKFTHGAKKSFILFEILRWKKNNLKRLTIAPHTQFSEHKAVASNNLSNFNLVFLISTLLKRNMEEIKSIYSGVHKNSSKRQNVRFLARKFAVVATYMPKLTRLLHRCMHTSLHQYFIEDLKIPSAALLLQWNNLAASLQSLLGIFSEKNYPPLLRCFAAISLGNFFRKNYPLLLRCFAAISLGNFFRKNYPPLLRCFAAFPQNRSLDET